MLNLSDKELDRLSRDAAEQYEVDENLSSWEKLEQLLDKEPVDEPPASPPPSQRFGMAPLFYSALFILLVGSTYFFINHKKNTASAEQKNKPALSTEANKKTGTAQNNDAKSDRTEAQHDQQTPNDKNETTSEQNQDLAAKKKQTEDAVNNNAERTRDQIAIEKESAAKNNNRNDKFSESKPSNEKTATDHSTDHNTPNGSLTLSSNERTGNEKTGKYTRGQGNNRNGRNKNNIRKPNSQLQDDKDEANSRSLPDASAVFLGQTNSANKPATNDLKWALIPGASLLTGNITPNIDDSALRNFIPKKDSANAGITNPGKKNGRSLRINRSLIFGLMLAPDLTNVNSSSYNKLSTNFGLTIGYQFANRWSVNTGLIFTSKNYTAQSYDFHTTAPVDTWKDIKGNCKMIEIPLTLRYDLSVGRNTAFFANAGLSSYLMKKETYNFYKNQWGRWEYYENVEFKGNKNNYWFSMVNLSIGIEQYISPGLSLQVEPFAKLPLSGVGWGKLQLSSYGLSFSLRYSPVLKKSRH